MAKKGDNRANIELKCPECGYIIRPTDKNKKNTHYLVYSVLLFIFFILRFFFNYNFYKFYL